MKVTTQGGKFEAAIDAALKITYTALSRAFPQSTYKNIEINVSIDVNIQAIDPQNITFGEYYGGLNSGTPEEKTKAITTIKTSFEPAFKAEIEKNKKVIIPEIKLPLNKSINVLYSVDETGKATYKYNK